MNALQIRGAGESGKEEIWRTLLKHNALDKSV